MENRKIKTSYFFCILAVLSLFPPGISMGQDTAEPSKTADQLVSKSELEKLKMEWEAVREQQVQMIREKEDQLEKLKEEIFSKMKASVQPAASGNNVELEAQKTSLQAERQKFFVEMNRQKESLRQLQSTLDEKARQLQAERDRFEQEKKAAAR